MIPRRGFDSYSDEGGPFWEPEADKAFVEALKASLPDNIKVVELDYDINDPRFAGEMVKALVELMLEKGSLKESKH